MGTQLLSVFFTLLSAFDLLENQTLGEVTEFDAWKKQYGIQYTSADENSYRQKIFDSNYAQIKRYNSNETNTYKKIVNNFAALSQEEFKQIYLSNSHFQQPTSIEFKDQKETDDVDIDWTTFGAVAPPGFQFKCQSNYAFVATGLFEAVSFLSYGQLQNFSQQQIIDCSTEEGNSGCSGGTVERAVNYINKNGIEKEENYEYAGQKGECKSNQSPFKIKKSIEFLHSCQQISSALKQSPIAVEVDASNWAFYSSGIMSDSFENLNHVVLLVGIHNKNWIVKNSWGVEWGQKGYMKIAGGNTCGICTNGILVN